MSPCSGAFGASGLIYARPVAKPSFRTAVAFWLKLGCISFGGPAGQIAIMHDELVERRRWISESRFLHALAFCFALPGPEAQQLATYAGWRMHGVRGALAAGGLFVLPSFLLLCALSYVYVEFGDVPEVAGIVRGLGGAVVGLVLAALVRVGGRVTRTGVTVALAAGAFVALVAGVPFPVILVLAAGLALVVERRVPGTLPGLGHGADAPTDAPEPTIRLTPRRVAVVLGAWLAPVVALVLAGGVIAELAAFFTLTALITFGGAYAVLPFVADQAVTRFGWLSAEDMVAGLALGETTPGPLIMVNTFVGYLAGWSASGSHTVALAGAAVATLCTFAASFVFILLGGPFVDRLPRRGRLATALHGVSVAVVGVIAGLAVFVGRNVLVADGEVDWLAVVLMIGTFVAVVRYRVNVLWVIGVSAAAGLLGALV
jgi:chromate transporter